MAMTTVTAAAKDEARLQRAQLEADVTQVLARIRETLTMKDQAYAAGRPFANIRRCELLGIPATTGVFIRMTDKWSRIESLMGQLASKDPVVAQKAIELDESIADNMWDITVYGIIWTLLHNKGDE